MSAQNGTFVPEKSNIWRDCVDGMYDWVKEHILEVTCSCSARFHHVGAESIYWVSDLGTTQYGSHSLFEPWQVPNAPVHAMLYCVR